MRPPTALPRPDTGPNCARMPRLLHHKEGPGAEQGEEAPEVEGLDAELEGGGQLG